MHNNVLILTVIVSGDMPPKGKGLTGGQTA